MFLYFRRCMPDKKILKMSALEWLPLMYPPGFPEKQDPSGSNRRLSSLPPSLLNPHSLHNPLSNLSPHHPLSHHHHHHHPIPGLLPKPGSLYHPALLRQMSIAVGESAPSLPPLGFPSSLFMRGSLSASGEESLKAAFDLSSSRNKRLYRERSGSPERSISKAIKKEQVLPVEVKAESNQDDAPLDLSVKSSNKGRMDENQNLIVPSGSSSSSSSNSSPKPMTPPKKRSRSPTPSASPTEEIPPAKKIHSPALSNGREDHPQYQQQQRDHPQHVDVGFPGPHVMAPMFGKHPLLHQRRSPFPFSSSAINPQFVQQPYHDVIGNYYYDPTTHFQKCATQTDRLIFFIF